MSQSNPIIYQSNLFSLCITSKQTLFNMLIHSTYLHLTAGSSSHIPDKIQRTHTKPTQTKKNQLEKIQPQPFIITILEKSSLPPPCCTLMKHASQTASPHKSVTIMLCLCPLQWWKFIMKSRNITTKHAFKNELKELHVGKTAILSGVIVCHYISWHSSVA